MPIAPPNLHRVPADQGDLVWADIDRHGGGIKNWAPGHFVHAGRTGACQPEGTCPVSADVTGFRPGDLDRVIEPPDPLRHDSFHRSDPEPLG